MSLFDLPLEELKTYKPERQLPADYQAFWSDSLAEVRSVPLDARFEPVDFGLKTLRSYDVTYAGFGGQPVKAWLMLPAQAETSGTALPCVVEFIGYGGGRGYPTNWLFWASLGYAHLIMDTRGQGSTWQRGDTPDQAPQPTGPQIPGFMTSGVLDPHTYYYRRVFLDGVRAVEAARGHPLVNPQRIAVTGGSQGGGITLAVASLEPAVQVAMPDVPFLCHFRRAVDLVDTDPYNEIVRYCHTHREKVDQVFQTLSYFDGVNFAASCRAKGLFSVGLMDTIVPPSTVFAAYNHFAGEKEIRIYPFNKHEGGASDQDLEKARFLKRLWG